MIRKSVFNLLLWMIALAAAGPILKLSADPQHMRFPLKTIVLDPGHGGRDTGATGPSGTHEKDICLAMAADLAKNLSPTYKVILTRSDDYSMDNDQRAAVANHEHADLFISLHTGATFQRTAKGMAVYIYQAANKAEAKPALEKDSGSKSWQSLQTAHTAKSRALAEAVKASLENLDRSSPFQLEAAPLSVLQGADMPGILLELGQLSNPDTEKALNSEDQVRAYVRAVSAAIDIFFANQP